MNSHRRGVTVVYGPPAAGKSTYVNERRKPGDIVVDWDALLNAITGQGEHQWVQWACPFVEAARTAMLLEIRGTHPSRLGGHVWVIVCTLRPADSEGWRRRGAKIVVIPTPEDVCVERIEREDSSTPQTTT